MAKMRVKQLANEFGLSGAEMVKKISALGIAVKSHASMLTEEQVEQVRKSFADSAEDVDVSTEDASEGSTKKTKKKSSAQKKKDEEAAARRAEAEAELAERAAVQARRKGAVGLGANANTNTAASKSDIDALADASTGANADVLDGALGAGNAVQGKDGKKSKAETSHSSFYDALASNISAAKDRQERERLEAIARAKAQATARAVAKKQQVEAKLRGGASKLLSKKSAKAAATANKNIDENTTLDQQSQDAQNQNAKTKKRKLSSKPDITDSLSGLLSQIKGEEERIASEGFAPSNQIDQSFDPAASSRNKSRKSRSDAQGAPQGKGSGTGGAKKQTSKKGGARARQDIDITIPGLETQENSGEDRYAQMAVQAEKLQRDKVLAEARAAVAAASSNENEGRRKKRKKKREEAKREKLVAQAQERGIDADLLLDDSVVEIPQGATVDKFSELLNIPSNEVIKRLFMLGQMMTVTQSMSDEMIELIADDLGRRVRVVSPEEEYAVVYHDTEEDLLPRPPVVTVMGHVDHGKTSLLDAIRHTGVATGEAGGITQHIGASVVDINGNQITFIDTPGHEAFTAMRARGAQVTDVIVLVVAADDGVMPQTIEAINHAKAADVPIVVAVNKIDKDGANPDRVRQELTEYEVIPEEWGGKNMFVNVSAKKNMGIDDLLETIILQAEVLELKANPNALASGFVIEANLDKGRGPVATVLVDRGTLHPGDVVVAGCSWGRVRALIDPRGKHVKQAIPADPVEILGLNSVPVAGDEFRVFEDDRDARKLAEQRAFRERLASQESKSHTSLDDLFSRIEKGKQTDLNLIVKADVQGSIEALRDAFEKMDQSEVRINIVHSAVGGITETDVTLATASDAIIIGFNVRPTGKSKQLAEKERVDIRLYRVIYEAIEEINQARVGLLSPDIVDEDTGSADVREIFKVPRVGSIAGCYVSEGEISRDDKVRIVREGTVIFEGEIASLRRFKDDVKSVKQNYECGIGIKGYQDIKVGDVIESYRTLEVERSE